MSDAASVGSFVSDLHVADQARRIGESGEMLSDDIGSFDLVMRRQRSDADSSVFLFYIRELGYAADIDQEFGSGKPQLHHRDQAVPARQNLRAAGMFLQEAEGFAQRGRDDVFEWLGNHDADFLSGCGLSPLRFARKIFQTFSERIGISI